MENAIGFLKEGHPRRSTARLEPQPPPRQIRPEHPDPHPLVRVVRHGPQRRVPQSPRRERPPQLRRQQLLKRIRLDAERIRPKLRHERRAVLDDPLRRPPRQIRLHEQHAGRVDRQQHERRKIARAVRRPLARIEGQRLDPHRRRPGVEPQLTLEVLLRKLAPLRIHRRALLLPRKRRPPHLDFQAPQRMQILQLRPQHLRTRFHRRAMLLEERPRRLARVAPLHVAINPPPRLPQCLVRRPPLDGPKRSRFPTRRPIEFQHQSLAVQRGRQVHEIRPRRSGLHQGPVKPLAAMFAPQPRVHVRVVLQIVAHNERRPMRPPPPPAQFLPRPERLDHHPIRQHDRPGAPNRPRAHAARIALCQRHILDQLTLEVLQMRARLVPRVGNDPHIRLRRLDRTPKHVGQRRHGRLRAPPRPDQVQLRPPPHAHRVELVRQPQVHRRRRKPKMLREHRPRPIEQRLARRRRLHRPQVPPPRLRVQPLDEPHDERPRQAVIRAQRFNIHRLSPKPRSDRALPPSPSHGRTAPRAPPRRRLRRPARPPSTARAASTGSP